MVPDIAVLRLCNGRHRHRSVPLRTPEYGGYTTVLMKPGP
jgi:hypothetical protein